MSQKNQKSQKLSYKDQIEKIKWFKQFQDDECRLADDNFFDERAITNKQVEKWYAALKSNKAAQETLIDMLSPPMEKKDAEKLVKDYVAALGQQLPNGNKGGIGNKAKNFANMSSNEVPNKALKKVPNKAPKNKGNKKGRIGNDKNGNINPNKGNGKLVRTNGKVDTTEDKGENDDGNCVKKPLKKKKERKNNKMDEDEYVMEGMAETTQDNGVLAYMALGKKSRRRENTAPIDPNPKNPHSNTPLYSNGNNSEESSLDPVSLTKNRDDKTKSSKSTKSTKSTTRTKGNKSQKIVKEPKVSKKKKR